MGEGQRRADDDWTASLRNPPRESTTAADSPPTSAVPPSHRRFRANTSPSRRFRVRALPNRLCQGRSVLDPSMSKFPNAAPRRAGSCRRAADLRDLADPSDVRGFPVGWKGRAEIHIHTTAQIAVERSVRPHLTPRPMRSFRRRSVAWGFAQWRQHGSTFCAWDSRRQNVCLLDGIGPDRRGRSAREECPVHAAVQAACQEMSRHAAQLVQVPVAH